MLGDVEIVEDAPGRRDRDVLPRLYHSPEFPSAGIEGEAYRYLTAGDEARGVADGESEAAGVVLHGNPELRQGLAGRLVSIIVSQRPEVGGPRHIAYVRRPEALIHQRSRGDPVGSVIEAEVEVEDGRSVLPDDSKLSVRKPAGEFSRKEELAPVRQALDLQLPVRTEQRLGAEAEAHAETQIAFDVKVLHRILAQEEAVDRLPAESRSATDIAFKFHICQPAAHSRGGIRGGDGVHILIVRILVVREQDSLAVFRHIIDIFPLHRIGHGRVIVPDIQHIVRGFGPGTAWRERRQAAVHLTDAERPVDKIALNSASKPLMVNLHSKPREEAAHIDSHLSGSRGDALFLPE